jgi:3-oxoadipate enol-lactonase
MSGPGGTLVFLHPVGLDAQCVTYLPLHPVVAPTFPGHGDRSRARAGLTLSDMADEVVGWTNGPLDVVGASLGGMVALHLALDHPDRVRSLVLSCTTAYGNPDVMLTRAQETEKRTAAGMVEDTLTRWFRPEVLARSHEPVVDYARRRLLAMGTGALADTWRAVATHNVVGRLAEIDVPTTCVAGRHDVSTPPQVVAALADRISGAQFVEIEAAHMAHLEQPQLFSRIVREHLDRVRALTLTDACTTRGTP